MKKFEIAFTYMKAGKECLAVNRVWAEKVEDIQPLLSTQTNYRYPEIVSAVEILPYTETTTDLELAKIGKREARKLQASRPTYKAYTRLRLEAMREGVVLTKEWGTFDGFFAATGQIPTTGRIVRKDLSKGFTVNNCAIRIHVRKGSYPNRNNVRELIYRKAEWRNTLAKAFM